MLPSILQGASKAKKRSAYTDDGWHCDRCLGTQTSLRRNGPNGMWIDCDCPRPVLVIGGTTLSFNSSAHTQSSRSHTIERQRPWHLLDSTLNFAGQRMCTACYSKMQREKKKGEANGFCERPVAQEPESDSQLSVRGARPASTAARKFIEEFARNKGAVETASARQDGSTRRDIDMEEPITQTAAYGAALLLGAPRGVSEGLFAKAQFGVGLAGAHILQRDPVAASSRTMRYMTDHTYSTGNGEDMRASRNLSPDGPYPLAAPWPDSATHSQAQRIDNEDPSVIQGASNLMLLTGQSSAREVLITSLWYSPLHAW